MKHLLEENLKNVNKTNSTHHQHLYFRHSQHVGRTQTSCLLRQSLVNYPTIVEKVLKFLAFRQRQNIFPRLKGHNQNCISWRDIFNMLKSLRRSDLVSSALHKKLSFPLSISSLNLYHQLPTVTIFKFLQCVWIFVQTGGTKQTLAVKVPPLLLMSWLVSEKKVAIWNFGFT